jgi:hypothetical protein
MAIMEMIVINNNKGAKTKVAILNELIESVFVESELAGSDGYGLDKSGTKATGLRLRHSTQNVAKRASSVKDFPETLEITTAPAEFLKTYAISWVFLPNTLTTTLTLTPLVKIYGYVGPTFPLLIPIVC